MFGSEKWHYGDVLDVIETIVANMGSFYLAANSAVTFILKNGTPGIIAPEARRTYDHIIRLIIGEFPLLGLKGQFLSPEAAKVPGFC